MYIDTNSLPEDYDAKKWVEQYKSLGMLVHDPTKKINTFPPSTNTTTTTGNGLWSQISNGGNPYNSPVEDPWEKRLRHMEEEMKLVRTDLKLSRLKILSLEGKFNEEEVANIRKMIMSDDEAARTLADSIIENA